MPAYKNESAAPKTIIRCPICHFRIMDLNCPAHAVVLREQRDAQIATKCSRCNNHIGVVSEECNTA